MNALGLGNRLNNGQELVDGVSPDPVTLNTGFGGQVEGFNFNDETAPIKGT